MVRLVRAASPLGVPARRRAAVEVLRWVFTPVQAPVRVRRALARI